MRMTLVIEGDVEGTEVMVAEISLQAGLSKKARDEDTNGAATNRLAHLLLHNVASTASRAIDTNSYIGKFGENDLSV